mmetsp:Transcript_12467/g.30701  ORF Transcript_12467/g.30701 Transcript_12467/m.30701 type:complete len:288 (-) Transcript_12467:571-1434(-)
MNTKLIFDVIGIDGSPVDIVKIKNNNDLEFNIEAIKRMTKYRYMHSKQPQYKNFNSGNQTSAQSVGTGRALARVPRIKGSGTSSSGQGAISNMCRGGKVFGVSRIKKIWNIRLNIKQKTKAYQSAYLATLFPSLVISRGHNIQDAIIFPLIVEKLIEYVRNISEFTRVLKNVGGFNDLKKFRRSKFKTTQKAQKKGPVLIINSSKDYSVLTKNIHRIEIRQVKNINFFNIAPGGRIGRFCIYTKDSFLAIFNKIGKIDYTKSLCYRLSSKRDIKKHKNIKKIYYMSN